MSEIDTGDSNHPDEGERFSMEHDRLHTELRQTVHDVVKAFYGEEAEQFVADMGMHLSERIETDDILSVLYDVDSFFPGTGRIILDRWQSVASALRANAQRHLQYIEQERQDRLQELQKSRDDEILRHMEVMTHLDEERERRSKMSRPALAWYFVSENAKDLYGYVRGKLNKSS